MDIGLIMRKASRMLNERGWELPDPTPVARPVGWKEPESLQSMIARLVRSEVSRAASAAGAESFDEADDFDVGDDVELRSPYELDEETAGLERWNNDEQSRAAIRAAEERFVSSMPAADDSSRRPAGEKPSGANPDARGIE